jgi:hypothetical protein
MITFIAYSHVPLIFWLFVSSLFVPVSSALAQKTILQPENTLIVFKYYNDDIATSVKQLQKHLRKVYNTDKGFDIILDGQHKNFSDWEKKIIFAVGETQWLNKESIRDLGQYGFAISRIDNVITIAGNSSLSSLFGTFRFLDEFLGVRFYMPGDLFTSQPDQRNIELPAKIQIREIPFAKHVMGTGFDNIGEQVDRFWSIYNGVRRRDWDSHQHSMWDRFPPEKFATKYPEIYPVYNGQRYIPQSRGDQQWQPDFAEPRLVDAAVESAIEYFKSKPAAEYISYSVQDSRRFSTEGRMGEVLNQKSNSTKDINSIYLDVFIDFINNVASRLEVELPENGIKEPKKIVYISYSNVNAVPRKKLHPNVVPIPVFRVAESEMKGVLREGNWTNPSSMADWIKVSTRIGYHDWAQGNGYLFPRIYSKQQSDLMKFLKSNKISLEYAHLECYPNWGLDGPKYYIISRLLWNPDLDPDQLLTKFCDDMFGRAAREMKNYFIALENLTLSMNNNPTRMRKMFSFPQQLLLDEREIALVKKAREHLNKASQMVKSAEEKKRIELFSKSFRLSEYLFELANSEQVTKAKVEEVKKYAKDVLSTDTMTFYAVRNPGNFMSIVNNAIQSSVGRRIVD